MKLSYLLIAMLAQSGAGTTVPDAAYFVRISPDLTTMNVELCFGDWSEPPPLVSQQKEAERFRSPARVVRGEIELRENRRGIAVKGADPDECIAYDIDLERLGSEGGERALRREGASVLTSSGLWLWRPKEGFGDREARISIDMPAGMAASVPWPPLSGAGEVTTYRLTDTPKDWRDLTAFGRLETRQLEVGDATLRLAIADGDPAADPLEMAAWIEEAARAVSTLYGRFPLRSPQIVVVPIGRRAEAVPWAQVQRGGGASAHFFVDQHRSLREFRDDWTATHELSHMLLPYVTRRDAWLSEGMASYYQNVLRARAGMITEEQAWEKLYAGFGRGLRGTGEETLAEVSRDMHRSGAYMRVYWSGAAIALEADVELRRRSGGETTLDLALGRLADCCLPSHRTWTAREVMSRLDELVGTDVFMALYSRHTQSARFPDLETASDALGIQRGDGGLSYSDDGEATRLRQAIMSTPQALLAEADPPGQANARSKKTSPNTGDSGGSRSSSP